MNRGIRVRAKLVGLCVFVAAHRQTAWGQEQRKVEASPPPAKPAGAVPSVGQGIGIVASPNPMVSTGTIAIDTNVVPRIRVANTFAGNH